MSIQTRLIEYAHAGVTYEGLLAWDDAATQPRPGVAVAHTWAGRSEFEQGKAVELAGCAVRVQSSVRHSSRRCWRIERCCRLWSTRRSPR